MNNEQKTMNCFTLVEMLIVVAIIALLASMVIGIASRIDSQSKEELVENTFALLNAALGQFRDYGYGYKHADYSDFDFPLDCNDFLQSDLAGTLADALDASVVIVGVDRDGVEHSVDDEPEYSGCEVLCFFLNRVTESRRTLEKIDSSQVTSEGTSGNIRVTKTIIIDGKRYPLIRIIDPWGETLRYDYYEDWKEYHIDYPSDTWEDYINYIKDNKRNFPVITSAGPDRIFGTDDDISSR